ncbi:MAG: methyltransferase domain-containing protein [bacterium]
MTGVIGEFRNRLLNELQLERASCFICGKQGKFQFPTPLASEINSYEQYVDALNLRENFACRLCSSSGRDRMMMYALALVLGEKAPLVDWKRRTEMKVFETTGQRAHPSILRQKYDYYNTEYDPVAMSSGYDIRRYADVQKLPYESALFDICLSSDVFEHVRLYEQGFLEIYRILKPSGALVMTVPYVHGWEKTHIRVQPEGERDIFLEEPIYHAGHTLVYRVYGRDLLAFLQSIGFSVAYVEGEWLEHGITHQNVIIALKSPFLDISNIVKR